MDHLIDIESSERLNLGLDSGLWVNFVAHIHIVLFHFKERLQILLTHYILLRLMSISVLVPARILIVLSCSSVQCSGIISSIWPCAWLVSLLVWLINLTTSSLILLLLLVYLLLFLRGFLYQLLQSCWIMSLGFKTVWLRLWLVVALLISVA